MSRTATSVTVSDAFGSVSEAVIRAMTYFGPFTIDEVERCIGDFTMVWMKPREALAPRGPEGQRPMVPVGLAWPCGCDARGESSVTMRASRWAPCEKHRRFVLDLAAPTCTIPAERSGGYLVPRDHATMLGQGALLFEAVPYSL